MERLVRGAALAFVLVVAARPTGSVGAQPVAATDGLDAIYLGYTGNLPHQELGFVYGRVRDQGWGYYIDVKISMDVPGSATEGYYEDITVAVAEAWGHTRRAGKTGYFSVNTGITGRIGGRMLAYGGFGLCGVQPYRQYYDPSLLLGSQGEYWIDGGEQSVRANLMLGVLVLLSSRLLLQSGVESLPRGFTVGLAWLLHRRR